MGLGLLIERSEACINDPSLLKITNIIPTFMSADSFLDSATFQLTADPNAHGGFSGPGTKSAEGSLALGIGRENINGVLPLYLFKEHWEIARRRAPPIFGFMCTLDVMGYQASQMFAIPFKVLLKALEMDHEAPSEINKKMVALILDTCRALVKYNEDFRKNLIT